MSNLIQRTDNPAQPINLFMKDGCVHTLYATGVAMLQTKYLNWNRNVITMDGFNEFLIELDDADVNNTVGLMSSCGKKAHVFMTLNQNIPYVVMDNDSRNIFTINAKGAKRLTEDYPDHEHVSITIEKLMPTAILEYVGS